MRPVVFTAAAQADVLDAIDWYEARQPGLGLRFLHDIDALVARIGPNPARFPTVRTDVRHGMLRRFPYNLFVRGLQEQIRVIACFHTSRDPVRWLQRL